jgi:hypothetical protein
MKLTLTRKHHLVTEKYGHLDIEATVELDTETDHIQSGLSYEEAAHGSLETLVNPTLNHLNRSLDQPEGEEFIRAWIESGV